MKPLTTIQLQTAVAPLFVLSEQQEIAIESPRQFTMTRITSAKARQLNALWHSVLPNIKTMVSLCFGFQADGQWYAVALWSKPAARLLPQQTWLELRRFAISPDAPKNTASWCLAKMEKFIRADMPQIERLISYQATDVHQGTIYRAANWRPAEIQPRARGWAMPNRVRRESQNTSPKIRWERNFAHQEPTP